MVKLRPVEDADLDAIFAQMRDPDAVRMAAFTHRDHNDRAAFDAWMARIRANPTVDQFAVTVDDVVVGTVASFVMEGDTEVTYWVDRAHWGQGIATAALAGLVERVRTRPLHARAASDNIGSLTVLRRAGFREIGTDIAYAEARQSAIEETILRLDA